MSKAIEHLPLLCLEDVFVSGYLSQLANCDRYAINHDYLVTPCPLFEQLTLNDIISTAVIGDKCSQTDLDRIHKVFTKTMVFA